MGESEESTTHLKEKKWVKSFLVCEHIYHFLDHRSKKVNKAQAQKYEEHDTKAHRNESLKRCEKKEILKAARENRHYFKRTKMKIAVDLSSEIIQANDSAAMT